ncbi:unnamed protein product [Linum trigynum]|uniref:Uncharacterized protein n=1 Tax=Linum trigynum TaxID=586398 RepID=A0AAV2DW47_9ROSI
MAPEAPLHGGGTPLLYNFSVAPDSLLVRNREEKKIHDAFDTVGAPLSKSDIGGFCSQTSVYWPRMDVTNPEK